MFLNLILNAFHYIIDVEKIVKKENEKISDNILILKESL